MGLQPMLFYQMHGLKTRATRKANSDHTTTRSPENSTRMSNVRFNYVFIVLLLASFLSAFVFPARTSVARASVQGMFYPVARPSRAIASRLRAKFDPPADPRAPRDILIENERLRTALASLTGQIEHLQKIASDRERFGNIGKYCTPVAVMGNDPARRDSLSIQGAYSSELIGRPALYIGGLAGVIERAGVGGAQVKLVTDRSFGAVTALFGSFQQDAEGRIFFSQRDTTKAAVVEGAGMGTMRIRNFQVKDLQAAKVSEGDWVVLDDNDYPALLKNAKLGRVISIKKSADAALVADVEVRPEWNLMALNEVMVLNK